MRSQQHRVEKVHYDDLDAPVIPSKAVCVGLNYKSHIDEWEKVSHRSQPCF